MGGGTLIAFLDFPEHGDAQAVRGIGAMHHIALRGTSEQYAAIILNLKANETEHLVYGNEDAGSVYFCDPNRIVLDVRIEYWREAQRGDPNAVVAGLKTKHRGRTRRPPAHPILTCVQSRQYRGCMISKN